MKLLRYIANLAKVDRVLAQKIIRGQLAYREKYGPPSAATHFRKVLAELSN